MRMAELSNPRSLSYRMRARRDVRLRSLIKDIHAAVGSVRILDLGGTFDYWRRVGIDFLRANEATVVVLNVSDAMITGAHADPDVVSHRLGDGCAMPEFATGEFDLAHSNSVIEHVGGWPQMKSFASELRRVARSYYVQTPYFWFPIDPHFYRMPFYHWLPRPTRARLLNSLPLATVGKIEGVDEAFRVVDAARLLDRRQFEFLFPDGDLRFEYFAGLPKSLIATRLTASHGRAS